MSAEELRGLLRTERGMARADGGTSSVRRMSVAGVEPLHQRRRPVRRRHGAIRLKTLYLLVSDLMGRAYADRVVRVRFEDLCRTSSSTGSGRLGWILRNSGARSFAP
jgi:hypothetical protein